jgi:Ser/Thr protein kinase RdoA (MazF antagonist)
LSNNINHTAIIRAFDFQIDPQLAPESIYPYAPVFRLSNSAGQWIVKQTRKPLPQGQAIANWTRSLAAHGLRVVTPASGFGDNPRSFWDEKGQEEVWVVYPFIQGEAYQGDLAQVRAAGDLLGRLHAAGLEETFGLKVSETVVPIEAEEIAQDIETVVQLVSQLFPEAAEAARTLLEERSYRYFQQALPRLLETHLPLTNGSWDYKASNLIYETETAPVLVDPDNGGRIPRAYDLAIAVLLFHNDGVGPRRLFTEKEWKIFLEGYWQHSQLSEAEMACWADLLLCAWMDEALWLLRDHEAGWLDPGQSRMLLSLLTTDLSTFFLSS